MWPACLSTKKQTNRTTEVFFTFGSFAAFREGVHPNSAEFSCTSWKATSNRFARELSPLMGGTNSSEEVPEKAPFPWKKGKKGKSKKTRFPLPLFPLTPGSFPRRAAGLQGATQGQRGSPTWTYEKTSPAVFSGRERELVLVEAVSRAMPAQCRSRQSGLRTPD